MCSKVLMKLKVAVGSGIYSEGWIDLDELKVFAGDIMRAP